jgi:hypothetical protein
VSKIGLDLFEEKNLWSIYKQCVMKLPASRFNVAATSCVILLLLLDCYLFPERFLSRLSVVRSLGDLGLGFGSTILGFLIAGFTIFATLTKPDLFIHLYNKFNNKLQLSYLKISFFAFVEVFVVYISLLVTCLTVRLFGSSGGIVSGVITWSNSCSGFPYYIHESGVINLSFVLLGTLSFYSFLALKSFVYNIYHTVILSIFWILNLNKDFHD